LSGFVLYPLFVSRANAVIPFGAVVLGLVLYTLFHPGLRKNTPPPEGDAADEPPFEASAPGGAAGASPGGTAPTPSRGVDHPGYDQRHPGGATPREVNGAYGVPVAAPVVAPGTVADSN